MFSFRRRCWTREGEILDSMKLMAKTIVLGVFPTKVSSFYSVLLSIVVAVFKRKSRSVGSPRNPLSLNHSFDSCFVKNWEDAYSGTNLQMTFTVSLNILEAILLFTQNDNQSLPRSWGEMAIDFFAFDSRIPTRNLKFWGNLVVWKRHSFVKFSSSQTSLPSSRTEIGSSEEIRNRSKASALSEHALKHNGIDRDINFFNISFLKKENNSRDTTIAECKYIENLKPQINRKP